MTIQFFYQDGFQNNETYDFLDQKHLDDFLESWGNRYYGKPQQIIGYTIA